jgi:hypothetical protein
MKVFCPTCRTMREVMDTYETDTGDRTDQTVAYVARPLECGHDAGDGGGTPYRRPPTSPARTRALVEQVARLQEGAQ